MYNISVKGKKPSLKFKIEKNALQTHGCHGNDVICMRTKFHLLSFHARYG